MDEAPTPRSQRLSALRTKIVEEHRSLVAENGAILQELVALIRDLDPIRRRMIWPADVIRLIAERQDWKCPDCGTDLPSLNERAHHIDHVVPWSLGGGNETANIQILHVHCNLSKGNRCDLDTLIFYLKGRLFNMP